jgi:hypothetical protein
MTGVRWLLSGEESPSEASSVQCNHVQLIDTTVRNRISMFAMGYTIKSITMGFVPPCNIGP